jgi:hypothetical protein
MNGTLAGRGHVQPFAERGIQSELKAPEIGSIDDHK